MKKRPPPHFTVKDLRERGLITRSGRPAVELFPTEEGDPWTGAIPWQTIVPGLVGNSGRQATPEELDRIAAAMLDLQAFAQWKWLEDNPEAELRVRGRVSTSLTFARSARMAAEKRARDKRKRPRRMPPATLSAWLEKNPQQSGQSILEWLSSAAKGLGVQDWELKAGRHTRTLWRRWQALQPKG